MVDLWQYLVMLFLNSFLCLGIYKACDYEYGMAPAVDGPRGTRMVREGASDIQTKSIFWFVKFYGTKWVGETLMSPICGCVICMASVHSIYVYWFFHPLTIQNVVMYIAYVFCLAGLNTINARFA